MLIRISYKKSLTGTWNLYYASNVQVQNHKTPITGDQLKASGFPSVSLSKKTVYLIEWESDIHSGRNHYLAGQPPFDYEFYLSLMQKTGFSEFSKQEG